jgi:lipopolysaccharide heptosyltransferase I
MIDVRAPMKILFIKLSAIGDVVQTLPALEAIKKTHPHSDITWVVEEAAAGILEGHPLIDTLLVSKRKAWFGMLLNPFTFCRGFGDIVRFIRKLRSVRYDVAVDFQGLLKSGVLIGLARARRKIGFDRTRELSYLFLNERLPAFDIEKHALERYLDIARYLGAKDPSSSCTLPIDREVSAISGKIRALNPEGRPLVVVNPVARWTTKLWPERNFSELADRLVREKNALVVFTGGPEDRAAIGRIVSGMREKAVNWTGETTLKELAALATLAGLFITTDTGPMHLAAAAGGRVLALFGPTAPWRTGPYGPLHAVIRSGAACSPCFQRKCGDVRCMRGITVDEVVKNTGL